MRGEASRELAVVEEHRALGRQLLDRVGELRNREALSHLERATRPVEGVPFRRVAQQRIEDLVQIGLGLVEDDAVAREAHRRPEQLGPRQRSPAA